MWTRRNDLALVIVTADCVPVLLAAPGVVAAVHAGWRGIVAGVVPAALEFLGPDPKKVRAWIGPAIGECCYEVGEDVAAEVAGASAPKVVLSGSPRPHLNLQAAVLHQLSVAGVEKVETVARCTRCHADELWSYRREGAGAGRNHSLIWLQEAPRGAHP